MSGILAVLAISVTCAGGIAVLVGRTRRLVALDSAQQGRGRDHELHWAAIRLRSKGYQGPDLQEMVCTVTNCTPSEADAAIERVGANI